MRIHVASPVLLTLIAGCASAPKAGPLSEGMGGTSRIVAVDSMRPPASATVQLEEPAHVAMLLVIPGHSATLLYPRDSVTDTRKPVGQSRIAFEIPGTLVRRDSAAGAQRRGAIRTQDSTMRRRGTSAGTRNATVPVPGNAPTFLLLLTSSQPLVYQRIIDRTAGVSIPSIDEEALNAVAKAVRATLPEPRTIAGYFQLIEPAQAR